MPFWLGAGDKPYAVPGVPGWMVGRPSFAAIAGAAEATNSAAQSVCLKDMATLMNDAEPNDRSIASIRCGVAGGAKGIGGRKEGNYL